MMAGYVLGLVCVSLICGVCLSLLEEGTVRAVARLLCGVILSTMILSPLSSIRFGDLFSMEDFSREAEAAAAMGRNSALDARQEIIKQKLEAYIQDKALSLGAEIRVRVTLDAEGYPVHAELAGILNPERKRMLSRFLSEELGIAEEEQQWIG